MFCRCRWIWRHEINLQVEPEVHHIPTLDLAVLAIDAQLPNRLQRRLVLELEEVGNRVDLRTDVWAARSPWKAPGRSTVHQAPLNTQYCISPQCSKPCRVTIGADVSSRAKSPTCSIPMERA